MSAPLADGRPAVRIEIRVRYALADLVSIAVIVRHEDGWQWNAGLLSMPASEWHHDVKPLFEVGARDGRIQMDDDTVRPRRCPTDSPQRSR